MSLASKQQNLTSATNADYVSVTNSHNAHQPLADPSNSSNSGSHTQPQLHDPTHHVDRQFAVRLPKLELPVFNGEPLEWHPFWDCFEAAIHTNPSLTNVQRLTYLRSQVKGEAARVIAGLPLTNLNYHHSVTLLEECYGKPQQIISSHIQALVNLRLFHNTIFAV